MEYLVLLLFATLTIYVYIASRLIYSMAGLRARLMATEQLVKNAQERVSDMGAQLFNLTAATSGEHPGYVYVLQSISGYYKIGRTVDPHDRAKTFGVKLPMEVRYLVLIQTGDCRLLENTLHRQYQHKRVNGEWFQLSDNDLLFLRNFPGGHSTDGFPSEPIQ